MLDQQSELFIRRDDPLFILFQRAQHGTAYPAGAVRHHRIGGYAFQPEEKELQCIDQVIGQCLSHRDNILYPFEVMLRFFVHQNGYNVVDLNQLSRAGYE